VAAALAGAEAVGPFPFMVLLGLGLYLPYVAVHTTLFERLVALTRDRGNIGYLMYLAGAFGYLGYVAVMLARTFGQPSGDFPAFFFTSSWAIALISLAALLLAVVYFARPPVIRAAERTT